MEEKGLKNTLVGTSDSNGTPLTLSFPSETSIRFSKLSDLRTEEFKVAVSFGGAMEEA